MNVIMSFDEIIQFLVDHHDYSVQFFGAFTGSFLAFCFLLVGERLSLRRSRIKRIRKEHGALERYFGDVHQLLHQNREMAESLIRDYQLKKINFSDFVNVPVRREASMNISDIIFINKLEFFCADLQRMNYQLQTLTKVKARINEDLVSEAVAVKNRAIDSLEELLGGLSNVIKGIDFLLAENHEHFIENQILLKKYNNWRYRGDEIQKAMLIRNEEIEKESLIVGNDMKTNPIFHDRLNKLRKFGIADIKD